MDPRGDDELKKYGETILLALDKPHNAIIVNYCKSQSLRMWSVIYSSAFAVFVFVWWNNFNELFIFMHCRLPFQVLYVYEMIMHHPSW